MSSFEIDCYAELLHREGRQLFIERVVGRLSDCDDDFEFPGLSRGSLRQAPFATLEALSEATEAVITDASQLPDSRLEVEVISYGTGFGLMLRAVMRERAECIIDL